MGQVFEATDVDLAEQILRESYGGNIRLDAGDSPPRLRLEAATVTPSVRLDRIIFGLHFDVRVDPLGTLVICRLGAGRLAYHPAGGEETTYGPGDAFIPAQPERGLTVDCAEADFHTAVLDPALLDSVAATAPGRRPEPVRFTSHQPVSAAAAEAWDTVYGYARETVDLGVTGERLLAGSVARLLATTALTVFPNNTLSDPTIEDRHDAHRRMLRRAMVFVEENADRDITLADIAAAAHATIRAVRLAFRRHLDTTPTAYLRSMRLERAAEELKRAGPADDVTVAETARRWGWAGAPQLVAAYRRRFGSAPTESARPRTR
ncbi:helix-turn-helix domain-containing protein [Micromonospora sp. WMMC241]|uniref:helix-turn-helix domain-containing protein n=1 Tax=Micromonospora sp. WMMC241 TaxID=3015159 RepID=UPI0022B5F602|nr:helix-turn-helix domain-containing protein [Micromonospora sp. WMMC241]MCZ7434820.1 helix-turn-helix domain-containing protein [Micromonospora sp. WMMC241]